MKLKRYAWIMFWLFLVWMLWCVWGLYNEVRGEEQFFFSNWTVAGVSLTPSGNLAIALVNPNPEGKIRKVNIVLSDNKIMSYSYLDEIGNLKIFIWKEGGYKEKVIKDCLKCHVLKREI